MAPWNCRHNLHNTRSEVLCFLAQGHRTSPGVYFPIGQTWVTRLSLYQSLRTGGLLRLAHASATSSDSGTSTRGLLNSMYWEWERTSPKQKEDGITRKREWMLCGAKMCSLKLIVLRLTFYFIASRQMRMGTLLHMSLHTHDAKILKFYSYFLNVYNLCNFYYHIIK